jgi:DNA polymerase-3 subunit epsilon
MADDAAYELYIDQSPEEGGRWQNLYRDRKVEPLLDMLPVDLADAVILDTETTGLDEDDQIIEIGIIDAITGGVLFHSLVKPFDCAIHPEAEAIHGINEEMLAGAPGWLDIHDQVMSILTTRRVIGYNVHFDLNKIRASWAIPTWENPADRNATMAQADAFRETMNTVSRSAIDVMYWYAPYAGYWHNYFRNYTWVRLASAYAQECGKDLKDSHRALGDCAATLAVIKAVNAKLPAYNVKQAERREARRQFNAKVRDEWRIIKERQDVERARLETRRKRTAERKAARLATLEANTISRSDEYLILSQRPAGYMTATDILKAKREDQIWRQVGICATAYGDRFKIYLPASEVPSSGGAPDTVARQ